MSDSIDTNVFDRLIIPDEMKPVDRKYLSRLTAISEPESKLHGIKAIKILEYFAKIFEIPLCAQVAAVQRFMKTLREKKGEKQFKSRTTEGTEYLMELKEKIQHYNDGSTPLFRNMDIPVTKISNEKLLSKTGKEAYKCTICRLAFETNVDISPFTEIDAESEQMSPEELKKIDYLASDALRAAQPNAQNEFNAVQQLLPFARDLARLCVASTAQPKHCEKAKDDSPEATDLESLIAQTESYKCEEPIQTECGHDFGTECLQQWVKEQGHDVKCPYCRKRLSRKGPKPQAPISNYGAGPGFLYFSNVTTSSQLQAATNAYNAQKAHIAAQHAALLAQLVGTSNGQSPGAAPPSPLLAPIPAPLDALVQMSSSPMSPASMEDMDLMDPGSVDEPESMDEPGSVDESRFNDESGSNDENVDTETSPNGAPGSPLSPHHGAVPDPPVYHPHPIPNGMIGWPLPHYPSAIPAPQAYYPQPIPNGFFDWPYYTHQNFVPAPSLYCTETLPNLQPGWFWYLWKHQDTIFAKPIHDTTIPPGFFSSPSYSAYIHAQSELASQAAFWGMPWTFVGWTLYHGHGGG